MERGKGGCREDLGERWVWGGGEVVDWWVLRVRESGEEKGFWWGENVRCRVAGQRRWCGWGLMGRRGQQEVCGGVG